MLMNARKYAGLKLQAILTKLPQNRRGFPPRRPNMFLLFTHISRGIRVEGEGDGGDETTATDRPLRTKDGLVSPTIQRSI